MNTSSAVNLLLRGVPPARPPIVLIGHGRSGTSWIANALARSPEVLYYNDPCNPDRWADSGFEAWFTHAESGASVRISSALTRGRFVA